MKNTQLKKIIRESIKKLMDAKSPDGQKGQEREQEREVEVYHVNSSKTGGNTIKVDRNHEMWSEVKKGVSMCTPKKVKKSTKLNEGIFCCWARGGCCDFLIDSYDDPNCPLTEIVIGWGGCCGNSGKGSCCEFGSSIKVAPAPTTQAL